MSSGDSSKVPISKRVTDELIEFAVMPLIWPKLHRSLAFFILLLILNALEEIVVGLMHGRKTADSLAGMGGGSLDQLVATSIVGLLILIPFFAFRVLGEAVGERNLVRVFFQPRSKIDVGARAD